MRHCLLRRLSMWFLLAVTMMQAIAETPGGADRGPYAVGSTNFEVAPRFVAIGDEAMHAYLPGEADEAGEERYIADILRHPGSAWLVDVAVPDQPDIYGPASGRSLPVAETGGRECGGRQPRLMPGPTLTTLQT